MKDLTLVVMAAGMGSRFGGLKQITPVDDEGNFLIDYSIYDAKKAGFSKVVFIIKEEMFDTFQETVGKRIEGKIQVEYAFQRITDVPDFVNVPPTRVKPWGTVQAILAAKPFVNGPFAVINADDFYGFDSYRIVSEFLQTEKTTSVAIPYPFCNVDSKYGFVKRGVLYLDGDSVSKIVECNVGYEDGKVIAKPLDGDTPFEIEANHPVSMNMFGFQKSIFDDLEHYFENFMKNNLNNLDKCESLISEFLEEYLDEQKITLKYCTSNGLWIGMTYKEDLEEVKEKLQDLKKKGEYPVNLWEE